MFKFYPVILSLLFFSCEQTPEKIKMNNTSEQKSIFQNQKPFKLNCNEVLIQLIKSSNLKSIKDFSDWKFRIDEKTPEKFLLKIYKENNLSDDPAKKQMVENALSWLEFYPKSSKLLDITFDPENPVQLNFDKKILQQNNIFEICGVISPEEQIQKTGKTDCKKINDEMLSGEECIIYSTTISQEYLNLIKNKMIDDTDFLQKTLPKNALSQKINKNGLNEIVYAVSNNNLKISLFYDGGETSIELRQNGGNVVRKILYSYD